MSPIANFALGVHDAITLEKRRVAKPTAPNALVLEAWAQGYMVGSLIIMACITMANMRKGVILHKLILLELILGIWHGFWMLFDSPVYEWWLSCSAILLNISWSLHNVIAWMKIRPFLSKPVSIVFMVTVIIVQPYWVVEIYANFAYFHNINTIFLKTRPWEPLCRDPWWIFTTIALFYNIKVRYDLKIVDIMRISPRFGIMLGAMVLSVVFTIVDVLSVTGALEGTGLPVGLNPFWKLSFVFKCLTDSVILDDFKVALDRLRAFKISRIGSFSQDNSDRRTRNDGNLVKTWEAVAEDAHARGEAPHPDDSRAAHHFRGFKIRTKSASKGHNEHKDSVVSPTDKVRNSSHSLFHPEDPTLEEVPIRNMENARLSGDQRDWIPMEDAAHMRKERDYYKALREVSEVSPPTSPTHQTPRRSLSPWDTRNQSDSQGRRKT